MRLPRGTLLTLAVACTSILAQFAHAAPSPSQQTAQAIDRSLRTELPLTKADRPAAVCDDTTFLRRATLDLLGRQPSAAEITRFALDPAADKRAQLVQRLLASEDFGRNWGRYWRDVIMYRRSDPRAQIASSSLETFLTTQLNSGTPWSEVARQLVTATGDVREEGATGLLMAQEAKAEETAAEVSRIFLGIQIQCAQCHDHPTDRWKREQFHQLAAFFPRMSLRPVMDGQRRTFEVVSMDRASRFRPQGRGGSLEHYMTDLNNPGAQGKLIEPQFFVTDQQLKTGLGDQQRRAQLADWMTAGSNPWFAKAYVNRMWAELVGEGFVEPVDDLGPDRPSDAPETFDLLATQFAASGHDVKWLFATIMATEAYNRDSRDRRAPDQTPFAANCAQRLRGDQLFSALAAALGLPDAANPAMGRGNPYGGGTLRDIFNQTFGFDPSLPPTDLTGSIPQALFLMNSRTLTPAMSATSRTPLGRMLAEISDDEEAVVELYLRCLAREPKDSELTICREYIREVGNRGEAFEDLQWSLINSTEFLHRK